MDIRQAKRMENATISEIRIIMDKCARLEKQGKKVLQFTVGEPDFITPEYIREAAKTALDEGMTKYPLTQGTEELRECISAEYRKKGLEYGLDEIIVTAGAAQGMFVAMMSYLNEGDEILVPDPGYNSYPTVPNIAGAVVKTYDLLEENGFQPDPLQLESLITEKTKMIVLISPNNPIGSILSRETVEAVADIVRGKDILVISDEIYEKLNYEDEPVVSIAEMPGMKDQTIIINGFSKYFAMTGWRVGWIAASKQIMEPMLRLSFHTTASGSPFIQKAAAAAILNEDDSCRKMLAEFTKRKNRIVERINAIDKLSCLEPKGAFYVFMNIKKTGMTSDEFADFLLEECRVGVVPGTVFGKNGEGFVRVSYATSMEVIEEGMDRIKAAVDKL